MRLDTVFKRLDLGKNSSRVYSALLKIDKPLLVAHIAARAQVARAEVYRNIPSLLSMGFIEEMVIGKRSYYKAASPRRIAAAFRKAGQDATTVAESLANKRNKDLPNQMIYLKGPKGIRAVFDDVISRTPKKHTFYRYTSERNLDAVNRYLSPHYRTLRDKKKLERLVISNPVSGSSKRPRLERFIKFIQPNVDLFDQNIIQLIYADSIALINLTMEEAFILRDKDLADFQTVIFKQLYKKL